MSSDKIAKRSRNRKRRERTPSARQSGELAALQRKVERLSIERAQAVSGAARARSVVTDLRSAIHRAWELISESDRDSRDSKACPTALRREALGVLQIAHLRANGEDQP